MDILSLRRRGISQRKIALKLGISRNTVKKYIDDPTGSNGEHKPLKRPSQLDPFAGNIEAWLEEDMEYTAAWICDRRNDSPSI